MKRRGWLWFAGVQAAGICCVLIPIPALFHYVGGFLLLPGSLLPLLLGATMRGPVPQGVSFQVMVVIAAIVLNALSWRSTAQVLRDQGLT